MCWKSDLNKADPCQLPTHSQMTCSALGSFLLYQCGINPLTVGNAQCVFYKIPEAFQGPIKRKNWMRSVFVSPCSGGSPGLVFGVRLLYFRACLRVGESADWCPNATQRAMQLGFVLCSVFCCCFFSHMEERKKWGSASQTFFFSCVTSTRAVCDLLCCGIFLGRRLDACASRRPSDM